MAYSSLAGWLWQFAYFAHTEALRRIHGPHDLILRARLDVTISTPILPSVLVRKRRHSTTRVLSLSAHARVYTAPLSKSMHFMPCMSNPHSNHKLSLPLRDASVYALTPLHPNIPRRHSSLID